MTKPLPYTEPNHDDPKITCLTNVTSRKTRVIGTHPNGDRVAYTWDSVTAVWRRDWDFGSATPARSFGVDAPSAGGFGTFAAD
ncbi:hypothetical protein SAMN05216466_10681 [Paraburkholderia phenazinium]|uniref:Uncharacterized protein n=1 Tax=Paraburkholderia phenazinium TaxID=60549 RepID=A0A1G7Y8S8_9BURK|nr:hypothetical protein [Paraburkholderia phenazinium]SDG92726.1 hypothetical protein SAMN05216466_10681 [Paraburkholderia phenazinium]